MSMIRRTNSLKHLITLIHDEVLDLVELQALFTEQTKDTTRRTHKNVGRGVFERVTVLADGDT